MGFQIFSNPILFAAVAVAAVGFAIYEIVSHHQNRQQQQQRDRRGSSRPRPPPPSPPSYPKKPPTETSVKRKSSVETSCTPKSIESSDHLRKRTSQTESKSPEPSSKLIVVNQDNVDEENLDIKDYNKNVLDKIQNDINRSYHFDKNIIDDPDESESIASLDDNDDKVKKSNKSAASTSSGACSASHFSSDADSDEEMYKKDVRDVLKNDIEFHRKACDSEDTGYHASGVQSAQSLNASRTPPGICKACEQNRVNARAYPCNHDYLCIDCAVKMFRLLKKCNICYAVIREFKVIES